MHHFAVCPLFAPSAPLSSHRASGITRPSSPCSKRNPVAFSLSKLQQVRTRGVTAWRVKGVWPVEASLGSTTAVLEVEADAASAASSPQSQPQTMTLYPESRLQPPGDEVWYFTYGSNMNPATLMKRRVKALDSLPAAAPGFVMTFSQAGFPYAEPCFSSLEPAGTHHRGQPEAEGVLHRLSAKDWQRIQDSEGVGMELVGYKAITVQCRLYTGQVVQAQTLTTNALSISPSQRQAMPSGRYLTLLTEGAAHFGVSQNYQNWLSSLPTYDAPDSTRSLGQLATQVTAAAMFLPMLTAAAGYMFTTAALSREPSTEDTNRTSPSATPQGPPTSSSRQSTAKDSAASQVSASSATSASGVAGSPTTTSSSSVSGPPSRPGSAPMAPATWQSTPGSSSVRGSEEVSLPQLAWKTGILAFGLTQSVMWSAHDIVWKHVVGDGAAKPRE